MVAWAGGYFAPTFKDQHGMKQRDPLSPTIFKVVFDKVIQNWVSVVAEVEEETGPEGFVQYVKRLAAYLCVDDNLLASMRVERLKRLFGIMMDIFYRVGM